MLPALERALTLECVSCRLEMIKYRDQEGMRQLWGLLYMRYYTKCSVAEVVLFDSIVLGRHPFCMD